MSKRKPAERTHKAGSDAEKFDELQQIQRALREYERDGHVSDPVLAARIRAGWRPSVEMALWSIHPDCPYGIKAICLKTLVEREPSKVDLMRLADGADGRPPVIQISIAAWAADPRIDGAPKAIELQPAVDMIASDREGRAHSSMPASPDVSNPAAIDARHAPGAEVYETQRGADGIEHAVRVRHEHPSHDDGYEIVHDDATGTDIRIPRYRGVQDG